jgi:asparagine synthase (glutamine-hydrolysing)
MNTYTQFCVVVDKLGTFDAPGFEIKGNGIFTKGSFLSPKIIGNIYSYQKDKGVVEVEQGLLENSSVFLKDFVSDFSFVFFGEGISTLKSIVAARDHMGISPLFYYNDDKILVIANDQRLMIDIPGINMQKDDEWIADYISNNKGERASTFYKHIKKVLPAHYIKFENNTLVQHKYWDLDLNKRLPKKTDEEYIREFRALLQEAVECRIPSDVNVGSEVSGGIDCTSIAAIAKSYLSQNKRELFTYAHAAIDDNNPSEKKPIEKFLTHLLPHKHTFIPIEMKGMKAISDATILLRNGVSKSHYSLFSRDIYRAAQIDGVKVILSGNGGDHCVSFKGVVLVIQQLIVDGEYKKAWIELRMRHGNVFKSIWKFITAILNLWIASPNATKDSDVLKNSTLSNRAWLERNYPDSLKYFKEREKSKATFSPVREQIYQRVYRGDLSERGEHTTIAANEFGVLYRYPLLDFRLMQYMVSLPTHLYYHNNMNRYIFREAIKAWVPLYLAQQPKPPGNMYGWISEAYDYDRTNNISSAIIPSDEEIQFYLDWWNKRSDYNKINLQKDV